MRTRLHRLSLVLAAAALALTAAPSMSALAAAPGPVQDPVPIGHNQFFTGLINGHPPGQAVIYVLCPGPVNHGHPTGHQPIEVQPVVPPGSTSDLGFTGSAGKSITASLAPSATTNVLATFTSYFVKKFIPTTITVPCSGTGTVAFAPSPHSSNSRTALLTVTFINLGA
jgi:hypothetical protein